MPDRPIINHAGASAPSSGVDCDAYLADSATASDECSNRWIRGNSGLESTVLVIA